MRPDGEPAKELDLAIRAADKRLLRLGSTLQSKGSSKISLDQLCPQCPASSGDLSVPATVELQELHYRFNSCLSLFTATVKLDASRDPRYRAKLEQWMVANLCRRRVEIVLRLVDFD